MDRGAWMMTGMGVGMVVGNDGDGCGIDDGAGMVVGSLMGAGIVVGVGDYDVE